MPLSRRDLLQSLAVLSLASPAGMVACSQPEDAPAKDSPFQHGVASGDPLPDAVILWTRVTTKSTAAINVRWEMSTSKEFTTIDQSGTLETDGEHDFTVKIDAKGLKAGTTYYYRFVALGETSPVGRTKTAPTGSVARLRLGVVSCASLAHGYFHAYRHLATRLDLDAIVHLGDYVYEYGNQEYGEIREYEPPHEIVTLADYRMRYAQYRRDPDLAAVHRQFPFITVWDDHETADNSWSTGAKNHDADEGDYAARRVVAARVYSEWMPIRDQASGKIYRALAFGDLVDLIMLDTRIVGRDEEAENKTDAIDPTKMRQLLGAEQETFLRDRLQASPAKWQLLGQQVVMATFSSFFNTDAWDGYPVARERMYALLEANPTKDVVVLTGDVHMSFAFDLVRDAKTYDPATGVGSLGVEVVVPGVTSPGFPEQLANAAKGMVIDNKNLKWANVHQKGYAVLDITPERVQSAWYHYSPVEEKEATPTFTIAYSVAKGKKAWTLDAAEAPAPGPSAA